MPASNITDELPTVLFHMIQITGVPRVGVTMASGINAPPSKFLGFVISEIPMVSLIENTVSERTAGAHGEEVSFYTGAIRVDIKYRWALSCRMSFAKSGFVNIRTVL